ncbi:BTB/POZ domain-containing protein At3g22104-like isoform X2 [Cornus florida]|uniref:BTB/POZ domain-containing protein At3g22104-like isoform X2 n=1 Tax=Cornus florida TaxID=4283 RepID=UPI0028993028|nr:BTB/POZ domain-containing protein At3g22104-like isoform X2 [Cornus florida]XP_059661029.1 BTB/POZ domain-containing protein At3g22104-like isoform X2 [Cornus florida]
MPLKIISLYSSRISKLFGKSTHGRKKLKLIFHDFPGGAESFELMTRFCYNNGKIEINPFNLVRLHCIAHFMEMNKPVPGTLNLLEQTEKSIEEIKYWTWSELLVALKQCQNLLPGVNFSGMLQKCLDSLVGRLELASETSPCPSTSSSDSSEFQFSCDARSTKSLQNSCFRTTWWFEDLVALWPDLVEMVVKSLVSRKFNHVIISRFLFYYLKSRLITATSDEKCKITEAVIVMLYSLDWTAISCKSLFGILRAALSLNISKCSRKKLESMIGSMMDQATLDDLLLPSPVGMNHLYDVNLVLRFLKSFLSGGICRVMLIQLKKVASLMDLYLAEVAPDPCLKSSTFLALLRALPDSARDSYDGFYRAMDMYLEVHAGLSDDEKINICCGLKYEKLSSEAGNHLAQNTKFPSQCAIRALTSQQCKLKSLFRDTNQPKPLIDSPCSFVEPDQKGKKGEASKQIVLYAGKLNPSAENEKLRARLQGMQSRVLELEKACKKMESQMTKIMKSRLSSHRYSRSLPRLCS